MVQTDRPAEPWRSFFTEVDALLTEDVDLHCRGGFVVTREAAGQLLRSGSLNLSELEVLLPPCLAAVRTDATANSSNSSAHEATAI